MLVSEAIVVEVVRGGGGSGMGTSPSPSLSPGANLFLFPLPASVPGDSLFKDPQGLDRIELAGFDTGVSSSSDITTMSGLLCAAFRPKLNFDISVVVLIVETDTTLLLLV